MAQGPILIFDKSLLQGCPTCGDLKGWASLLDILPPKAGKS
jgi:hypothetical protein